MGNFSVGGGINIPLNSDFKKNFSINLNGGYQKNNHSFNVYGSFTPFDKSYNIGGFYSYYHPISENQKVQITPRFNLVGYGKNIQQVQINPTISYTKDNITHSLTPGISYSGRKYFINPGYNINIYGNEND